MFFLHFRRASSLESVSFFMFLCLFFSMSEGCILAISASPMTHMVHLLFSVIVLWRLQHSRFIIGSLFAPFPPFPFFSVYMVTVCQIFFPLAVVCGMFQSVLFYFHIYFFFSSARSLCFLVFLLGFLVCSCPFFPPFYFPFSLIPWKREHCVPPAKRTRFSLPPQ